MAVQFAFSQKTPTLFPSTKIGDKQCLQNYQPVSYLVVYGKTFQRLIRDKFFIFFIENNHISPDQVGLEVFSEIPAVIYSFEVNTMKPLEECVTIGVHDVVLVSIVNFDKIPHTPLVFPLLTLKKLMSAKKHLKLSTKSGMTNLSSN